MSRSTATISLNPWGSPKWFSSHFVDEFDRDKMLTRITSSEVTWDVAGPHTGCNFSII